MNEFFVLLLQLFYNFEITFRWKLNVKSLKNLGAYPEIVFISMDSFHCMFYPPPKSRFIDHRLFHTLLLLFFLITWIICCGYSSYQVQFSEVNFGILILPWRFGVFHQFLGSNTDSNQCESLSVLFSVTYPRSFFSISVLFSIVSRMSFFH